jgi:putative Holliday junction resolvase
LTSRTLSLLAVDFGTRKLGIAAGQTLTRTAMGIALLPVKANEPDWAEFDRLVAKWKPDAFVVGLPLNMDGTESSMSARARRFMEQLGARYSKPCHAVDERLSTREARDINRQNAELLGKKINDRARVDAMAAQLLLESWFECGQMSE